MPIRPSNPSPKPPHPATATSQPSSRQFVTLEPAVGASRTGTSSLTNRHLEPHEPAPRAPRTAGSRPEAEPAKQIHGTNRPDSSDKSIRFTALIHPIHGANPLDKNLYCAGMHFSAKCVLYGNGMRFGTKWNAFWHKMECVLAQNGMRFGTKRKTPIHNTR